MKSRPRFLDLSKIVLPYPGVVSILHRVSGVAMVFSWPFLLPIIGHSLHHDMYHAYLGVIFSLPGRVFLWLISCAFIYHICSGIRHFYDDYVNGQDLYWSRFSAKLTLVVAGILCLFSSNNLIHFCPTLLRLQK